MIVNMNCYSLAPSNVSGFALLYTDPPYSTAVHKRARSHGIRALAREPGAQSPPRARDFGFAPLSLALRRHIAALSARICGWSLVYSDLESAHLWRLSCVAAGAEYVRTIPWVRWSQPQLSGDRPPSGCEALTLYWSPAGTRKSWTGFGGLVAFAERAERGSEKHPTAKPLDQALRVVSWFSEPGAAILDPCAGRGTACVAAALLGRDAVGFELDAREADLASAREANALRGVLSDRDRERARRFVDETIAEAGAHPAPRSRAEEHAYERAQARLADARRVAERL